MNEERMVVELLIMFLLSGSVTGVLFCLQLLMRTLHRHHRGPEHQSPHDKHKRL